MTIEKTNLEGVLLVKPDVHEDFRGEYVETYNEKFYSENGIPVHFVQDDISLSSKGVLRGIHGDGETYKLISCMKGRFYFVVVNCDEKSKDFGKWSRSSSPKRTAGRCLCRRSTATATWH